MIKYTSMLITTVLLSGCLFFEQDEEVKVSVERSAAGHTYTLINVANNEDVAIHVAWPTDWNYRERVNKAVPWVGSELILAGGAQDYPPGEVVERFADMNAEGYLYMSTEDHLIGELVVEKQHLLETVSIANAHLRAPTLDERWLVRVRDRLAQDMMELKKSPSYLSSEVMRWAVLGDSPLNEVYSLDKNSVFETITREEISLWHAQTLTASPQALVVVGDITPQEANAAVDQLLKDLPVLTVNTNTQTTPNFKPRRILLHQPDLDSTYLAMLAPVPPTRYPGEEADILINHVFGGDDQSVLFNEVREKLRASYSFGSYFFNISRDLRFFGFEGELQAEKVSEAERIILEAYANFRVSGPSSDLTILKKPFVEHFEAVTDYINDIALIELQSALDGYEAGRSLRLAEAIEQVNEASLLSRLNDQYPQAEDFIVIIVSPNNDILPNACVITTPKEALQCQ